MVKSKSALARAVGVVPKTIRNWIAHPDWPFSADGPWDEKAVRRWRDDHTAAQQSPSEVRRLREIAQTRLTQAKVAVLEDKYIPREQHEEALQQLADAFVQSLVDLERTLPQLVADRSPPEVQVVLAREFDHARVKLVRQAEREQQAASKTAKKSKSSNGALKRRPGRKPKNRAK